MAEVAEGPQTLDEFPEEVRNDVEGLAWLGHLEEEFSLYGHHFVIRTLKGEEELYAGTLTKEYQETITQAKAWAWANISLSLVSVDHDNDFCPAIGSDGLTNARGRFQYCLGNWYWFLADEIFKRLLLLNLRAQAAAEAIQDLSERSPEPSSPSPDSLKDQGISPEILDYVED